MGRPLYFAAVVSIFLLSFFFLFPRLVTAVRDWMPTILPHMGSHVWKYGNPNPNP